MQSNRPLFDHARSLLSQCQVAIAILNDVIVDWPDSDCAPLSAMIANLTDTADALQDDIVAADKDREINCKEAGGDQVIHN